MKGLGKDSATWLTVDGEGQGQRIDNLLIKLLKGVPRSHIYLLLRSGQVRINSARVEPTYRLRSGDRVRLPPVRRAKPATPVPSAQRPPRSRTALESAVVFEDDSLLVLDKPAGLAVHGGSGISRGAIEELRLLRPHGRFLELVHRLDRDTSGVLLLAKKRSALVALHAAIRDGAMRKLYRLLVVGAWPASTREISAPLTKFVLPGGDRRVRVEDQGLAASTLFERVEAFDGFTLMEAQLVTGRTHQIRVHAAHGGHPIAGDDKYGDFALNKQLARAGLKRMFLHAARVEVAHPLTGAQLRLEAPLAPELDAFLRELRSSARRR